jgi:4-hydroxy-tetrahydrodipicolinate synthase
MMFQGCTTALVTPFRGSRLDIAGLRRNVRFQVRNGVAGLLAAGSTGEAAALSDSEWERVVATVVAEARGRVPVMVGCGTNSTAKSVPRLKLAKKLGADASLVVAPYYVKPTQEGLYRHFRALHDAVDLPMVLYNIPGRSSVNVLPATVERLARVCPRLVAVKEASGNVDQSTDILSRCGGRLAVLSGDDSLTLPILAVGGKGVISVVSNIVPADVAALVSGFLGGDVRGAAELHRRLFPLVKAMFVETNPIPVKAALGILGMAAGEPRLPLVPLSTAGRGVVRRVLRGYGLLGRR